MTKVPQVGYSNSHFVFVSHSAFLMFNVFVTETNQTVNWDFGFAALFNLKFTTAVKPDP